MNLSASRPTAPQRRALLLAIVLLLVVSTGMAWVVARGLTTDATYWPAKRPSPQRVVARATEPVMYWTSIAVYATIGLGTFGLAAWGIREGRRLRA
jgi:hypothetical protein